MSELREQTLAQAKSEAAGTYDPSSDLRFLSNYTLATPSAGVVHDGRAHYSLPQMLLEKQRRGGRSRAIACRRKHAGRKEPQ